MKILVMGASCAGSTTLGTSLSQHFKYPLFDSDDYFWEKTNPPFMLRREPEVRNLMIAHDIAPHENWILSGSVINWAPLWLTTFNLVVFLYIPHNLRMQRLKAREIERYGTGIFTDADMANKYQAFTQWASGYDDNTTNGRNLQAHKTWLGKLSCPILEINGDTTVAERMGIILQKTQELG
ncbi:adenylate kinase [Mucilaginibacter sp. SP1R1]|uniref:adenylate kinase n=1 Tax=Mucilaginibacter sp. SP1R1 TaxID=2723091 RepID=UPI00162038A5|nr:adenylate kinase [Mucilaginibacter sp. SP1R1]MBB6150598.1 adenylate kinase family enzyme [Mucilaginibacter sp. SP1R1]